MRLALILIVLLLALAGCGSDTITGQIPDGIDVAPGEYRVTVADDGLFTAAPYVPEPTPTVTVTATVTATPASTPTPTPTAAPAYTTMQNARLESGRTYDHVIFTGGSSTRGVLHISYNLSNVVLRDCIIDSGPQNGWTINAKDNVVIENITVDGLTIRPQPRMGLEFTDRTSSGRKTANWRGVTLTDVILDPQGSEAVSLCGNMTGFDCRIRNMLICGSGNRPDLYPWGQGFEINKARGITVDGLTIRQTRGSAFNLQGPSSSTQMGWSFRNVTADMRVRDPDQTQPMSASSQVLYCKNVGGGWTFSGLVVGTASDCGYLDNVRGADFTGTTWVREGGTARVTRVNSTGNTGLPN